MMEPTIVLTLAVLATSLACAGASAKYVRPADIVVDVSPPQPSRVLSTPLALSSRVLVDTSGKGNASTQRFSVAAAWLVTATYDCSTAGTRDRFAVELMEADGDASGLIIDTRGRTGNAFSIQQRQDTFSLRIISSCAWKLKVEGPPG
jgi:hypothetical protein